MTRTHLPARPLSAVEYAEYQKRLPSPSERRSIRERTGVSQAHLARDLDVSVAVIGMWERGERGFSRRTLRPYVELLERLRAMS